MKIRLVDFIPLKSQLEQIPIQILFMHTSKDLFSYDMWWQFDFDILLQIQIPFLVRFDLYGDILEFPQNFPVRKKF